MDTPAAQEDKETRQMLEDFTLNLARGKHRVEIVHIKDPHNFYVRPLILRKYEQKVNKHASHVDLADLKLHAQVVYKSKLKGHKIRGEIQLIQHAEQEPPLCTMFAMDYGFTENSVSKQDIYKLDPNVNIPPLVVSCGLSEALPRKQNQTTWDEKAIDAFKYYVGDDIAMMNVVGKKDGKYLVELENKYFRDIADILAMTEYSVLGIGVNTVNRLCFKKTTKQMFAYKNLEEDQEIHVRVLSGKSLKSFFVAGVEDYKNYLDESIRFTYFSKQCNYIKESGLKPGNPVGVYSDHDYKYFRGIIQKVLSLDKMIVSLIDTGATKEVSVNKVKEMSEKFFTTPAVAIYCAAVKDQINDHHFEKLLRPGAEFYITVKKLGLKHEIPNKVKISNAEKFQ